MRRPAEKKWSVLSDRSDRGKSGSSLGGCATPGTAVHRDAAAVRADLKMMDRNIGVDRRRTAHASGNDAGMIIPSGRVPSVASKMLSERPPENRHRHSLMPPPHKSWRRRNMKVSPLLCRLRGCLSQGDSQCLMSWIEGDSCVKDAEKNRRR